MAEEARHPTPCLSSMALLIHSVFSDIDVLFQLASPIGGIVNDTNPH